MIKLKDLISEKAPVINRINDIIKQTSELPNVDVHNDLFQEKNNKEIILAFFADVHKALLNAKFKDDLVKRLKDSDLTGNPYDVYRRLNAPKHPVRNFLINPLNW
jgi:hypothetical protein